MNERKDTIRRMGGECFDVAVIGGGIAGCWSAYDASLRSFSVALIEKNDFGGGTSGHSSKLIHGGLRYLQTIQIPFVFEALSERHVLRRIAPRLVVPMPFLLPIWKGDKTGYEKMRMGMWLYDALALFRNIRMHTMMRPKRLLSVEPQLRQEGLVGAAFYYDCFVDDARLTLTLAKMARTHGAEVANHLRVKGVQKKEDSFTLSVMDTLDGTESTIKARRVINACGVWSDDLLSQSGSKGNHLRITKGIHVIIRDDRLKNKNTVVLSAPDGRFIYVIPWGYFRIIGTTEADYSGPLDSPHATSEEVAYLLGTVNRAFDVCLGAQDVVSTYAGLRPLVEDWTVTAYQVSREHRIMDDGGLISVVGGKLTTGRKMASDAVDALVSSMGGKTKKRRCATHRTKFSNWEFSHESLMRELSRFDLPEDVVCHLLDSYGKESLSVLSCADGGMRERIVPTLPYLECEIHFTIEHEFACTLTDFLVQRTRILYKDGNQGLECAPRVADIMGELLSWDEERKGREIEEYRKMVLRTRLYRP